MVFWRQGGMRQVSSMIGFVALGLAGRAEDRDVFSQVRRVILGITKTKTKTKTRNKHRHKHRANESGSTITPSLWVPSSTRTFLTIRVPLRGPPRCPTIILHKHGLRGPTTLTSRIPRSLVHRLQR